MKDSFTGMSKGEIVLGCAALGFCFFGKTIVGEGRDPLFYGILFALVIAAFWRSLGRELGVLLRDWKRALGAAGAGAVAFYGVNELLARILVLFLVSGVNENDQAILTLLGENPAFGALLVGLLAPFIEEALFRGLVFGNLRKFGRAGAYIVSCVLFALPHVAPFIGGSWGAADAAALVQYIAPAAVFAWTYERGGCIWSCVLLHCGINALALAGAL